MNENPTSEPLRSGPLLAAVEAQIEYIRFLEACLSSCSPYLAVHNWRFPESDIQRGEQLRANIAEKLKAANNQGLPRAGKEPQPKE